MFFRPPTSPTIAFPQRIALGIPKWNMGILVATAKFAYPHRHRLMKTLSRFPPSSTHGKINLRAHMTASPSKYSRVAAVTLTRCVRYVLVQLNETKHTLYQICLATAK